MKIRLKNSLEQGNTFVLCGNETYMYMYIFLRITQLLNLKEKFLQQFFIRSVELSNRPTNTQTCNLIWLHVLGQTGGWYFIPYIILLMYMYHYNSWTFCQKKCTLHVSNSCRPKKIQITWFHLICCSELVHMFTCKQM